MLFKHYNNICLFNIQGKNPLKIQIEIWQSIKEEDLEIENKICAISGLREINNKKRDFVSEQEEISDLWLLE